MKATLTINLDNGVLNYAANVGANDAIAMLETAKYAILRNVLGGVGRPPEEPAGPVSGGRRAPGLEVRRVDSVNPAVGR